jgi:hypothetical protein
MSDRLLRICISAYQGKEITALIEVHSTLAFQNNKLAITKILSTPKKNYLHHAHGAHKTLS